MGWDYGIDPSTQLPDWDIRAWMGDETRHVAGGAGTGILTDRTGYAYYSAPMRVLGEVYGYCGKVDLPPTHPAKGYLLPTP